MNKVKIFSIAIISFLFAIALGLNSHAAPASNSGTGQALEIAPPVITLSAKPGTTIKTVIKLRNISNGKLIVSNEINDFVAEGESGTPKILLEEGEVSPYSIKNWITPLPSISLSTKQIKDIPVSINIPANTSPGGYYGIIRFSGTPPELEGTGVSLQASLGSLILIRIEGQAREKLNVASFTTNFTSNDQSKDGKKSWLFETVPIAFIVRLKNDGNIHEQPVGQITIRDMFGKKTATVNVNLPPRNVLPQSIRKFTQNLDKSVIGDKQLFGRYEAELKVTYGDKKEVITSKLSFWVIPYRLIITTIVALIAGFILLRFVIKRYNDYIIGKAHKRTNKKR